MAPPAAIYFEESKINEQLRYEYYSFFMSLSFMARIEDLFILLNNIVE
jgi:hypothetical protein